MLDLSWSHILILLIVVLAVVPPKDLPRVMRQAGRWMGKARAMADQFRKSFDEMARQSELDELRREVEALRSGQAVQTAVGLGPDSGMQEVFDDIHTGLRDGALPAVSAPEAPAVPEPAPPDAGEASPPVQAAGEPTIEPSGDAPTQPARAAL